MLDDNLTNNISISEFSVSEISGKIKTLLENNLGIVRIRGEISGLKIASSGHAYFSLKDENAVLAATCWKHSLARSSFKLEEGLDVIATGKITAYAGQSKYQISVDSIEPSGLGSFMKILQQRRKQLEEEGLLDPKYKKKIPFLPRRIGIVTSITGSVIKDIIHRISDRFPSHLLIWPVSVQGETSASEVSKAIEGFNALPENLKPDLLIVARGGGSIEDLWSFNEEIVVRAAFASQIPIISAVGHETDYTLIDLVADLRAPTPTAAAEFAVPVLNDLDYTINVLAKRLQNQIEGTVNQYIQRIDDLSFRLAGSLPNLLKQKTVHLSHITLDRIKPTKILKYKFLQYNNLATNLLAKSTKLLLPLDHKLSLCSSLLLSLDYNNVINRGFAMIRTDQGKIVSSVDDAKKSSTLQVTMRDGVIAARPINT